MTSASKCQHEGSNARNQSVKVLIRLKFVRFQRVTSITAHLSDEIYGGTTPNVEEKKKEVQGTQQVL